MSAQRYEISYEINGVEGKRHELAESREEALDKARESFEEHGDPAPAEMWISAVWSVQY